MAITDAEASDKRWIEEHVNAQSVEISKIQKLREFVKDWHVAAELDGKKESEISVSLIWVLRDICEILEIEPEDIGLTKDEDEDEYRIMEKK